MEPQANIATMNTGASHPAVKEPYNSLVSRAIWEGCIPIELSWDPTEARSHGIDQDKLFMIEAPRCSYLPLLTDQVWKHIKGKRVHLTGDGADVWYAYLGIPLKWHYPIGLLYDLHALQPSGIQGTLKSPLPWRITVHCEKFPEDKLIRPSSRESCQDYFMSMLKEADYLRNGSTKRIMNMSKSDQMQLWDGLWSSCYEVFWGMNQKLVLNDGALARNLPIRFYLPENCPILQEPISPMDEQGQPRTLRQILNIALPDLFPSEDANTASGRAGAAVMIHGIVPSLDISALWLAQNMPYPDNFLHLVVLLRL